MDRDVSAAVDESQNAETLRTLVSRPQLELVLIARQRKLNRSQFLVILVEDKFLGIGETRHPAHSIVSEDRKELFGVSPYFWKTLVSQIRLVGASHRIEVGITIKEIRILLQQPVLQFGG